MRIDWRNCRIETGDQIIPKARFAYRSGQAVVWVEDEDSRVATRVLVVPTDATFFPRPKGSEYHTLELPDGSTWRIKQKAGGGCGCGSPFKKLRTETLFEPERQTWP